jgi:tetratricopeptide (TPR) repeat protein
VLRRVSAVLVVLVAMSITLHSRHVPDSESHHSTRLCSAAYNLAVLLKQQGRVEEAETWWYKAAGAGDAGHTSAAAANLAILLEERGRLEEAETWWRKAADAGDHLAETSLWLMLTRQGRDEEALQWLRRAADAGDHNPEIAATAQQALRDLRR